MKLRIHMLLTKIKKKKKEKKKEKKTCFHLESIPKLFASEVNCNPLRHSCTEVGRICCPSIIHFRTVVAHGNFDFV